MTPLEILYIVYWGASEPLGRSLVLPTLRELSRLGARLTLVTFDKPADLVDRAEIAAIATTLEHQGIRWVSLRYHKRPTLPATAFDIANGFARSVMAHIGRRPDVVHARTFVGGLIGAPVASALRVPLVYHNEGFYPDERLDAGVWSEQSRSYQVAHRLERWLYGRAEGIISLSRKAQRQIIDMPEVVRRGTPVVVVPSCVDLDRFPSPRERPPEPNLRLVYTGNVEGRYDFEHVARFAAIASADGSEAQLRILTHADPGRVRNTLRSVGLPEANASVATVPHKAIPAELSVCDAGLHFLRRGRSEHGGFPTKVGEYWASGLPIVITPNAGDTDDIARTERVGVVVSEHSDESYCEALAALRNLLLDPGIRQRCRQAAERHYALGHACERQLELYRSLVVGARATT